MGIRSLSPVSAYQLAAQIGVDHEPLRDMFRVGLPIDPMQLVQVSAAAVIKALKRASQARIIDENHFNMVAQQGGGDDLWAKVGQESQPVSGADRLGAQREENGLSCLLG